MLLLFAQEGPPPLMDLTMGLPLGPLLGIVSGVVLLGLLLWGLKNPLAWLIVSVLLIAAGVGCLVWGITQASLLGAERTSRQVDDVSGLIGGGAGGLAGGVVLLIVSLLRRRKWPENNP